MKNPLRKRLPRELKEDFGKYLVIFLFMVLLISLVSGFLVADNSIMDAYQKGFDQYNVEYGNLSTKNAIASKDRKAIEKENKLILYEQKYYELKESKKNATIRIYGMRKKVNTLCLMSGAYPKKDNEIALDRVFAKNNHYNNNDTIKIAGKKYTITGMVAFPDYSCLF